MSARIVTDYRSESEFRARIVSKRAKFLRRDVYRFVVERRWSRRGGLERPEDWRLWGVRGRWCRTRSEAVEAAEAWLDSVEKSLPADDDFVGGA